MPAGPVLPDVAPPGLAVLFCGSAAGTASARAGAYYAHPGNRFWRALHEAGLTPHRLAPADFARLPEFGLGLTDLAKGYAGPDAGLSAADDDVARLRALVDRVRPEILAFVGKRPARIALRRPVETGPQAEAWGTTGLWVLPSPSGQAVRYWRLAPWRALAGAVRRPAALPPSPARRHRNRTG